MNVNVSKLHAEIEAAGIPIVGCDVTGKIFFRPEATAAQIATTMQIVIAHDPILSNYQIGQKIMLYCQNKFNWLQVRAAALKRNKIEVANEAQKQADLCDIAIDNLFL